MIDGIIKLPAMFYSLIIFTILHNILLYAMLSSVHKPWQIFLSGLIWLLSKVVPFYVKVYLIFLKQTVVCIYDSYLAAPDYDSHLPCFVI